MPLILAVFIVCCLLPSVLWRCWLGGRKSIRPVKKLSGRMLMQLSVWSKVQTCIWPSWCHCHSLSLASVKSRLVQPFWYRLTWVVLEKGPLNGCVCVCVIVCCLSEIMLLGWDGNHLVPGQECLKEQSELLFYRHQKTLRSLHIVLWQCQWLCWKICVLIHLSFVLNRLDSKLFERLSYYCKCHSSCLTPSSIASELCWLSGGKGWILS